MAIITNISPKIKFMGELSEIKGIDNKANDFEQIKNKVIKPCDCKFLDVFSHFSQDFVCWCPLSAYFCTAGERYKTPNSFGINPLDGSQIYETPFAVVLPRVKTAFFRYYLNLNLRIRDEN